MPDTITLATFTDLKERLAEGGVNVNDVAARAGALPRIDVEQRGIADSALVLVVTTYSLDAKGKRYMDTETREAAIEVRRFRITADWHLIPTSSTQPEGETNA
jgi:hypothetical protein